MGFSFEVDRTAEGGGRSGRLRLPHGVVETPVFMPVGTAASVKAVPQSLLEEVGAGGKGAQIILAKLHNPRSWSRDYGRHSPVLGDGETRFGH